MYLPEVFLVTSEVTISDEVLTGPRERHALAAGYLAVLRREVPVLHHVSPDVVDFDRHKTGAGNKRPVMGRSVVGLQEPRFLPVRDSLLASRSDRARHAVPAVFASPNRL